jgi:hypothetical protein
MPKPVALALMLMPSYGYYLATLDGSHMCAIVNKTLQYYTKNTHALLLHGRTYSTCIHQSIHIEHDEEESHMCRLKEFLRILEEI